MDRPISLSDDVPPRASLDRGAGGRASARGFRIGRLPDRWGLGVVLVAALVFLPLFAVFSHLGRESEEWSHIAETVLPGYLWNTLVLVVFVSLVSLLFGVFPAWLVSAYDFPARRILGWALILPLSIPTYAAAFVFYQGPEAAIPLLIRIRTAYGPDAFFAAERILRYGLLVVMMAAVLYPYIYLACRATFTMQSRSMIEAARCLGRSPGRVFFGTALPLARPAIVAGTALVVMEVINDYGAVHFFGVPTLTEGIFRTWFGMGDRVSALRLASIVMLAVGVLLVLEHALRGRARYVEAEVSAIPLARRRLRGWRAWTSTSICLFPVAVGFLFPVWRLGTWAWADYRSTEGITFEVGLPLLRGLGLAGATALFVTLLAAIFVYAVRLRESRLRRLMERGAGLGYATPGAVIAVGVLVVFGALDRSGPAALPLFSGTLLAIGFAYLVRFFAIPLQFSRAGMDRLGRPLEEASRILGKSPLATFVKIDLPVLRGPLLAAAMLLFVDILKELPLTLILRPANFETLATTAYGFAVEARLQACAVPAMMMIAASAAGLLVMNRWMSGPTRHD